MSGPAATAPPNAREAPTNLLRLSRIASRSSTGSTLSNSRRSAVCCSLGIPFVWMRLPRRQDNSMRIALLRANRYVYCRPRCIVGIYMRSHSGVVVTAACVRVGQLPLGATWDLRQTAVNALSCSRLDRAPKLRWAERRQRRSEPGSANAPAAPKPAGPRVDQRSVGRSEAVGESPKQGSPMLNRPH